MQIRTAIILFLLFGTSGLFGQAEILSIWSDSIPHYKDVGESEEHKQDGILWISNVQQPKLDVYLPAKNNANGMGVLICPGGGYHGLAYDWEGSDIAKWFNSRGIAAFVLKYRLPIAKSVVVKHEVPLMDAQQALRLIRKNSEKWNLESDKIGIMGFSAGGHLASTVGTHFKYNKEPGLLRPDFMILVYPVITMYEEFTHMGSRNALIGLNPSEEMVELFSNETQISERTPPTLLIHSMDDKAVPVQNSLVFYEGLVKMNIPAEMHLYPEGGHGYSLAIKDPHLSTWPERMHDWLLQLKFENED